MAISVVRTGPSTGRLPLALRLAWRDWRSGELRLLLAAIVVAVASVTAISLFVDRLQSALIEQSATFLAADRVLSGSSPAPVEVRERAASLGLQQAETVTFATMLYTGEDKNLLASVKAVSDAYPLRGVLRVSAEPFGPDDVSFELPQPGEVWLDPRLFPALALKLGDTVEVGFKQLRVSGILTREPDRGGSFTDLAPRALMRIEDLQATKIIQPGSRVSFRYLLRGDEADLESAYDAIAEGERSRFRWLGARDSSAAIGNALARAESFLLLGGLLAVLLAGVAVALAAHRYARRHFDHVGVLKTLGATPHVILRNFLSVLLLVGTLGVLVGLLVGNLLQQAVLLYVNDLIPGELPSAGVRPYVLGAITGFICLLSFALPPLLALRDISPMRVIRRDLVEADLAGRLTYGAALGGTVVLLLWYSGSAVLTLYTLGAIAVVLAVFAAAAWLALSGTGALGMQAGSFWRLALAGIKRRSRASIAQMLIFGLAIMLLLILVLVRTSLLSEWREQLPDDVPNHFVMNVTPSEVDSVRVDLERISDRVGELFPMIRGRIVGVNGMTTDEWSAQLGEIFDNDIDNERNLTYSAEMPGENVVTRGEWWQEDSTEKLISLEGDYAERHGLSVGDQLDIDVAGAVVSGRVSNFRRVDWDSMRPNFFVIFSPAMLEGIPTTFMTSFHLPREEQRELNGFMRQFPTVSVIPMEDIIEQVQDIVDRVTQAIELVLALVLVSGCLVLLASIQSSRDERLAEHGLLRALGATRNLIAGSLSVEFLTLGALSGLLAVAGAELAVAVLQIQVFELSPSFHGWYWLAVPVVGALLVAAVGLAGSRTLIASPPMRVLRSLD